MFSFKTVLKLDEKENRASTMSMIEQVFIKEEVFLEGEENEDDDDDVLLCTPDDVLEIENNAEADSQSIPQYSKTLYWNVYNIFMEWMESRNEHDITEDLLLAYFEELAKKYKPPSLWSKYSMLRRTIKVKQDMDIHNLARLLNFLKETNKGYEPKRSEVLTVDDVKTFLSDAPDYEYLAVKVALIIALFGGCRLCDLVKLAYKDVEEHGQIMKITLRNRKNNTIKTFIIEGEMLQPIKAYKKLRPIEASADRFFLSYRNGKCINMPLGKNKFGTMPKEIAHFLNLPNPEQYTGHSFRRSSATLCKEQGISMADLKRLSGFRKSKPIVTRKQESISLKRTSNQITNVIPGTAQQSKPNGQVTAKVIPGTSQQKQPNGRITIVIPGSQQKKTLELKKLKLNEAPPQLIANTRIFVSNLPVLNEKLLLYSYWRSSCSYRVRIALNLKEIPYDVKPINIEKGGGEQHSDEFRKVNPMARVPALRIDNHTLIESLNILHYLEETRSQHPLLPADPIKRARVREICETITSGIQPLQNVGVLSHLSNQQQKEWPQFWITRGFMAVEELLSSCAGKYCVGDDITLADCCLIPQVYNARKFKINVGLFPTVLRIDKILEKHPAFVAAHPNNQPDCPSKLDK